MGTHPIFESDFDCLTEDMSLSDEAVNKQIEHMIAFIQNESQEKQEEIFAKADEEFQIEKGRLVNQQRLKIIEHFSKKEKQLEQQKRLQHSKFINIGRIRVLKAREEHISSVLQKARSELIKISENEEKYAALIGKLLLEACFQLSEKNALVICREKDAKLIQSAIDPIIAQYKSLSNMDIKIDLHPKKTLSEQSAGGLNLTNSNESIMISNTLEARLESIGQAGLPAMRTILFGENPNRKFHD